MVAAVLHRLPRLPRLRARTWIAIAVLLAAGATGGWLWLRDSSLVGVEKVEITGIGGPEQRAVEQALTQTAREMTTLNVDADALRAAVESYPQVKDVHVEADLLHTLRIEVEQRLPVAALAVGDERTPVAADGTVLTGHASEEGLPAVAAEALPAGGRLEGGQAADALGVLAAAPAAMRRYVESISEGPEGIEAQLRDGPRVILGTPDRPYAKWIATGRVLNDPGADQAGYIDVRLPERPAAGGFPDGVVPSTGA